MYRILLVEDDENTRTGLAELLRQEGYAVESVATASAARSAVSRTVNLILSDLHLPDVSGLDLLEDIRRGIPNIPSVMMTANGTPENRRRGARLGVRHWLQKPLDLPKLLAVIRETVNEETKGNPSQFKTKAAYVES